MDAVKRSLCTAAAVFVLLGAWFSGASTVHAAGAKQGLVVTPPTFELSANPGDSVTNSIRVDNLSDATLRVSTVVKNFIALGEEGQVGLTEEESGFSLASWISVDPGEAQLIAKGSHTFRFTIRVPANAEPGGRFGSIVFKTDVQPVNDTGLAVGQEIGTLIMLRIAGQVSEKAHITAFHPQKTWQEHGPVTLETRVTNDGNVHLKPTGTITITNFLGRKVATIPVEAKNVLPDATRKLGATWSDRPLFGRYTATVALQYGNQQTATASTTFTIFPYRLVLLWLGIFLVIGVLLFRSRRRVAKAVRILFGKE